MANLRQASPYAETFTEPQFEVFSACEARCGFCRKAAGLSAVLPIGEIIVAGVRVMASTIVLHCFCPTVLCLDGEKDINLKALF